MTWDPKEDGITHVNVYSRGQTLLGRRLSNFAHTPFTMLGYGHFASVEAFWFWISTRDESLRGLYGAEALAAGRRAIQALAPQQCLPPTVNQLRSAYAAKLKAHPNLKTQLQNCKLPLAHYYVYGGKVVEPREWQWTIGLWEEFKSFKPELTLAAPSE